MKTGNSTVASWYVLTNKDKEELPEAVHEDNKEKTYISFEAGQALRKTNEFLQIPAITRREKKSLF